MNKVRNVFACALLVIIAVVGLYACGGESPTATPPPPPTDTPAPPTATPVEATATTASTSGNTGTGTSGMATGPAIDLLNKASLAMKDVKTLHMTMVVMSGTEQSLTGEGDLQTPDKMRLTLNMGAQGESEIIVIGQDSYMKLGATGTDSYIQLPGTANPLAGMSALGDPQGFTSFAQSTNSADIVGDEKVDGADTTHVSFTYDLNKAMQAASAALQTPLPTPEAGIGLSKGEAWIDKSTSYIRKFQFVTTMPAGTDQPPGMQPGATGSVESTITITYSKFNEPISPAIEKPTNITTMPGGLGTGLGETPTP